MTQFELAKKTIETIGWQSFNCRLYASEGGACSNGWDDCNELELSPEEIRYLIKAQLGNDELFEGIETEEVDVDEMIAAMAKEGAWPDGTCRRI